MAKSSPEATKTRRPATARGSLSPLTLAERGLEIADAEGLDAVTIRRIASEHGVTAMAIYWHFKAKEDLLGAVADRVFAEVVPPSLPAKSSWEAQLKAELEAFLEVLRRHPSIGPVVLHRIFESDSGLAMANRILGLLIENGLAVDEAADVGTYLLCAVITLVTAEPGPHSTGDEEQDEAMTRTKQAMLAALSPEKYPYVVAAAGSLANCVTPKRYYDDGLEILVRGVSRLRD